MSCKFVPSVDDASELMITQEEPLEVINEQFMSLRAHSTYWWGNVVRIS